MAKTYTVEQIKTYIRSQDSLGDVLYFCTEENIDKAISIARDKITGPYLPPFHETWEEEPVDDRDPTDMYNPED